MHPLNIAVAGEKFCNPRCVFRMRAHPPWQGSHSPQNQPAIERRGDGPAFILNTANLLKKGVVSFCDHNSPENVAMAAEILCGRVKDKIVDEIERPLKDLGPGIVTHVVICGGAVDL